MAEWMADWNVFLYYFLFFIILSLIVACGITLAYICIMFMILGVSWKLHSQMVRSILQAPINTYFDVTPSGQITNRFSKDINAIDNEYAFNLTWIIDCLFWVFAAIGIGMYVSLWILAFVPIIFVLAFWFLTYYINTYWEVSWLETISNSPILTIVNESIDGAASIRSYQRTHSYMALNYAFLNHQI